MALVTREHFSFSFSSILFGKLIWLYSASAGGSAPPTANAKRAGDTPESRAIAELEERDETAAELSKRLKWSSLSTGKKAAIGAGVGLGGLLLYNQLSGSGNS